MLPLNNERVFVVPGFFGLRIHQVCVLPEASDEEILSAVNTALPFGTTHGWHTVVKDERHAIKLNIDTVTAPTQCGDCPGRLHKIVVCL